MTIEERRREAIEATRAYNGPFDGDYKLEPDDFNMRFPLIMQKLGEFDVQWKRAFGNDALAGIMVFSDGSGRMVWLPEYGRSFNQETIHFTSFAGLLAALTHSLRTLERMPDHDPANYEPEGVEP